MTDRAKPRPSRTNPPTPPGGMPQSNREKMADAVQQLVQQVKEQKAQSRAEVAAAAERLKHRQKKRISQLAVVILALIAALVYAIPRWSQPFSPPSGPEARQDARKTLVFAAHLLDQYELRSGRLPATFSQTGVNLPSVTYTKTGDTWVLSVTVDGQAITYHRGDDPVRFLSSH